jgi:excisionase family DNA binding protein
MSPLLSLTRLARRLGVPSSWLRQEADAGRIPCLRAGKRLLFNAQAVEEALLEKAGKPEGARP